MADNMWWGLRERKLVGWWAAASKHPSLLLSFHACILVFCSFGPPLVLLFSLFLLFLLLFFSHVLSEQCFLFSF